MKSALQKLWITLLAVVCLAACGSPEPINDEEAVKWIAAYSPEQIDMDAVIRIEATSSLLAHIDTSRSLDEVFVFTPAVKGSARYVDGGRFIEFVPQKGSLKQQRKYNCRVRLSAMTAIDSLADFSFDFVVKKSESSLEDLRVTIDPDNDKQVIVTGKLSFSSPPDEQSIDPSLINCGVTGARSVINTTDDKMSVEITISDIKRKEKDYTMVINYNSSGEFPSSKAKVVIPGLSKFKLISVKRVEAVQPYINMEFSAILATDQQLDGLVEIDGVDLVRIERNGSNVKAYYPINGLTDIVLRISDLVRANDGRTLSEEIEQHFEQQVIAPAIEIPISGTILPDGKNLTFPFRAVNLAAVDVEVVKIYTDNVMSFLQEDELDETGRLRRVGRIIYRQTVRLDKDKSLNLHQWQNFSIDLKNLFTQEKGAIYNIRLTFRKAYSLYNKSKVGDIKMVSGITRSDRDEWDKDYSYISRKAPDFSWLYYSWNECDDPSKESYYMVSSRMPEYNLMASNIGLIVKRADSDRLWCTATNLMTASAMSGVRITAYNFQMREIGSGYTNDQGFADFEADGNPFIVTASDGVSTTYLKLYSNYELSTSRFDVSGKTTPQGVKGFIYGERGVWRPGDEIHLSLIVEDKQKSLPANHPVTMSLYTPRGQLYDRQTLTKSVDGIYVFNTATAEDAPTGIWDAEFKVGGQTFYKSVKIETIKPNRLKINILADDMLQSGKTSEIGVESHWLTGPAAAGLKTLVEMQLFDNPQPFDQYKQYQFQNPLKSSPASSYLVLSCNLDSLGKGSTNYTLPVSDQAPGMMQANLIARVTEAAGDESITSRSVRYSPYPSYVGIDLQNKEFETDCDIEFPIVTVDAYGNPVDRKLICKIYELNWSWWWEGSADDLNRYVHSTNAKLVASSEISTTGGKGKIFMRVNYPSCGKYLVYVEDAISKHATGGVVLVDWPSWRGRSDREIPTDATMLSFSLDKKNYEVGEYATVYLPKLADGKALLSIENSSRVISRKWVSTSSENETAHRILVTKDMAPNFYVHASLIQPHAQTINDLPIRMYGIEGAEVVDTKTILHPVIEVADKILPQQEFTVTVKEQDGKPMSYTLAIVDEGLLDITAFKTPAPWKAMNQREALGVRTWDMYKDVIGAYAGKFSSILSIGGDEALRNAAGKEKRFNPVVKFLGPFTLNSGTKTHKITLPMYVGSVRVMVVAAKNGAYGNSDKTVTVRSPLMLLTTLPRQLNCGDIVDMPVNIFAMEDGVKDVMLNVQTEGPLSIVGNSSKQITFGQPSEKLVKFSLVCNKNQSGQAKVIITATGGGHNASDTIYIDVCNPLPDVVESETISIEGGSKDRFDCLNFIDGSGLLTIATMPTIDFGGAFSFVENYSHYCTEQLSARAMYILYARKFLSSEEQKRAEEALPALLKMIESRQLSNGGFAYWPGNNNAHEWVTSMAGEVMTQARRQGFSVSSECYNRWIEYQNNAARRYRHSTTDGADLIQSYRLYTLVLADQQPTAAMNKLRESKSISQQALLRLAATYALSDKDDVAEKLLSRSDSAMAVNGSYATFWSPLRDKAMTIESLLIIGEKTRAFKLALEVANDFSAIHSSTQELAFVSVAMSHIGNSVKNGDSQIAITDGNGSRRLINNLKGVKQLAISTAKGFIEVENQGEEEIFLSLMLSRTPSANENIEPAATGVEIDVQYTDLSGKAISVEKLRQGEEFFANIRVRKVAEDSQSMALTYAVPSGWEIWNERLVGGKDASQADYTDIRDTQISWYFALEQGKRQEFIVRMRAAYEGSFILPPAICEDMYNPSCRANTSNRSVIVER